MKVSQSKPVITDVEKVLDQDYKDADKTILILLFIHWFVATFLASHTFDTYMFGFISGGLIMTVNSFLYYNYRGMPIVRYSFAISLMLFSLLFIQQQLGRIEIHFHVFISIAFLTLYKDTFLIVLAAVTMILHH